ncbi:MAG TPA: hypothetical protein VHP37_23435 [Burkholderiales bacterium]|nr:hypothetical protein [Burkholderiales bacterium]
MKGRGVLIAVALAAFGAFTLAACGEKPQVTVYKQGKYQGKPDNVPWQGQPFNNDKAEWEKSIKARNNAQNEYVRVGAK